ncbi:MAG: Mo-dependent nitrogenase C-terminal domain-containing protein, partial [Cyanobacteria bacterium]|nr:Mo-dependent nitrogenase C-terminal domain-containing protein [Cyanobacteriota bacterium]MDW8203061.1 Mo-dependent nitrogenase C-terminal domain-containing protein [Cyanobacteriota bacterium SKYGB_h_bin112]
QSICQWIPAQCPFARTISWQGRTLLVIPPLCKLNPFYDELMGLRFRALSYLAEQSCADAYMGGQINAEPAKSC